jgi:hypothetical protein
MRTNEQIVNEIMRLKRINSLTEYGRQLQNTHDNDKNFYSLLHQYCYRGCNQSIGSYLLNDLLDILECKK